VTTRFIFVTGGVVSSLGKGLAAASIGSLLEARGFRVRIESTSLSRHRRRMRAASFTRVVLEAPGLVRPQAIRPASARAQALLEKLREGVFLADGRIEYIGRNDFQVKVRGYRIELGEVQFALARVANIAQCAVTVREKSPGDAHLAAYYSTRDRARLDGGEIREALRAVPHRQHGLRTEALRGAGHALEVRRQRRQRQRQQRDRQRRAPPEGATRRKDRARGVSHGLAAGGLRGSRQRAACTGFVRCSNDLSTAVGKAPRTQADRETSCYRGVTYDGFGRTAARRIGATTPYTGATCNNRRARCFGTRSVLKFA